MRNKISIVFLVFMTSCVSLHTPSTQIVPSIVQKNQFEGEISLGLRSAGVNFAYSPLNHLTLMGNVQALPVKKTSESFQRNCELAIGTYLSGKKIICGINAGYGMGSYNWNYTLMNDSSFYSLHTRGDFQKVMLQAFLGFTNDSKNPDWFWGLSVKGNYFWDKYASLRNTTQEQAYSGWQTNTSLEPCVFVRSFFKKGFYINAQAGMNISYDHSMFWPSQYLFTRLGCGVKF